MISLNTNISDLILLNSLNSSTGGINKTIERLTTGYKLNHAKDNAANLSIVTNLSTKINSLLKVRNNTEDGISLLSTAQGALENIQDQLARLRALSIQAANGNYGKQSLDAMQAEADEIIAQIKQIRENTEFNGLKLFETPQDDAVAKLSKAKVKSRSAVAPVALADDNTLSGAVDFAASETKTITIDGVNYTVRNKSAAAQTLSYTKDKTTGEVTLYINNMEVRGEENKSHKLTVYGSSNNIYGGKLNDSLHVAGSNDSSSTENYLYGGDGDDVLTSDCRNTYMYGENGNDTFNVNSYRTYVYGGAGDDIFNVNTKTGSIELYGQDGEDKFYINTSDVSAYVDGGAGTNYVENKSNNSILINVPNANAQVVEFNARETKSLTINGLNYEVTSNKSTASNFLYTINSDGAIEIKSRDFKVRGDANQKHNIKITAGNVIYYAGNQGDTVVSAVSDNTIYGGSGDDNITVAGYSSVFAGAGNNTISITYSNTLIKADNGNNTVILTNADAGKCSSFEFGNGDNTIQNAQRLNHSSVYAGSGKNTLVGGNANNSLIYGFGSADNASVFNVPTSGSSVLTVNGVDYEVSRRSTNSSNLLYRYNSVTGEVEFAGTNLLIKGAADVAHNVILQGGKYLHFYGGEQDDTVVNYAYGAGIYGMGGNDTITSTYAGDIYIDGGDGNDVITASSANIYGGAGDDTITIVGGGASYMADGGEGNDTYNLNSAIRVSDNYGNNIYNINCNNITVSGGAVDDTFYMKGNNNIVMGGGGNDYVVIDGSNNTVDGGTGNNFYVDNGANTTLTNVNKDPNSGMLVFSYVGEVKTFELNGKTYTVTNQNADGTAPASNQLRYSFNPNTGVITLDGSDLTVDSVLNSSHKLNIRGNNNTVNGGNLADIITIEQGTNNIVNALGGNDTINMNTANNSINAGDGNDIINLNESTNKLIDAGNGDDTIVVNSSDNTNINTGAGNDKITLNGANNTVELNNGNNTVNVRSDGNTITAGNGDNNFSVAGSSNTVTAGSGNNKVGVDGQNNDISVGTAVGDVNIYGEGNSYTSQNGDENVYISGNNHTVDTGAGNDKIEIRGDGNYVSSTDGDNDVNIRGNENSYQGGAGIDNITVSGNRNTMNGGDANDTYMVSKGDGNIIDGEGGNRNTMINNGKNTQFTNVVDITPRPFELELKIDLGTSESSFINMSISFNLFDFYLDFSDPANLEENLSKLDDLNSQVEEQLLNIGSVLDRLTTVLESQSIQMENLISTRSTLRDADIAKESSNLIKYQILQQASSTLMASTRNINAEFVLGILTTPTRTLV